MKSEQNMLNWIHAKHDYLNVFAVHNMVSVYHKTNKIIHRGNVIRWIF